MTTTYQPSHPRYLDPGDLRQELDRVFDLCASCRLCLHHCPAFPTLFDAVDRHGGQASALEDPERAQVVAECYGCKLCYLTCPYVPPHPWQLDFPRLMLRAQAVSARGGGGPVARRRWRQRLADYVLGRTDLMGRLGSRLAPLANAVAGRPGSVPRRAMEASLGVAAERLLPPYARQRFSTWFHRRGQARLAGPARARVAVFPTCLVEYSFPEVGRALVGVLERNRVDCSLPSGVRCCGAPLLHSGDTEGFARQARRNLAVLAPEVGRGRDVVVSQPTCGYVLRRDYPEHLGTPEAKQVAERTFDAAEYLVGLEGGLDTTFEGPVPASVAYHAACHLRAQQVGLKGRDLIALTGARVQVVQRCSGIDGTWGYRRENYPLSRQVSARLKDEIEAAGAEVVAGDCALANTAIRQETGATPLHPVQVLAQAYGLGDGRIEDRPG